MIFWNEQKQCMSYVSSSLQCVIAQKMIENRSVARHTRKESLLECRSSHSACQRTVFKAPALNWWIIGLRPESAISAAAAFRATEGRWYCSSSAFALLAASPAPPAAAAAAHRSLSWIYGSIFPVIKLASEFPLIFCFLESKRKEPLFAPATPLQSNN